MSEQIKAAYALVEALYQKANAPIEVFEANKNIQIRDGATDLEQLSRRWMCAVLYPLEALKSKGVATVEELAAYDALFDHAENERNIKTGIKNYESWWYTWLDDTCKQAFELLIQKRTMEFIRSGKMSKDQIKEFICGAFFILPNIVEQFNSACQEWWHERCDEERSFLMQEDDEYDPSTHLVMVDRLWHELVQRLLEGNDAEKKLASTIETAVMTYIKELQTAMQEAGKQS